jgi:hypothetical protein
MDLRSLELAGLTALASVSAVAALVHGELRFGTLFGVAIAVAAIALIRRVSRDGD